MRCKFDNVRSGLKLPSAKVKLAGFCELLVSMQERAYRIFASATIDA